MLFKQAIIFLHLKKKEQIKSFFFLVNFSPFKLFFFFINNDNVVIIDIKGLNELKLKKMYYILMNICKYIYQFKIYQFLTKANKQL